MTRGVMTTSYDTIGIDYSKLRKPDRRIERVIWNALGNARSVLNVGAGAGSYEPVDRQVTAIEPSAEMIKQRPAAAAPVIQGRAEDLPFDDKSFDASMAILTVHHWDNIGIGLKEMRRVTRGPVVLLTFDPSVRTFWLLDYIPGLASLDDERMPEIGEYKRWLESTKVTPVPIPRDCTDGFLRAYWRRPKAYLDPRIRAAMSSFWMIDDASVALRRLEDDLDSGRWKESYGDLLELDECDLGYRLIVSQ